MKISRETYSDNMETATVKELNTVTNYWWSYETISRTHEGIILGEIINILKNDEYTFDEAFAEVTKKKGKTYADHYYGSLKAE